MQKDMSWIPEEFSLNARSVMRMLYAMRDLNRSISADTFRYFVNKFEEDVRKMIDNEPQQIRMDDFQKLLEEETREP